LGRRLRTSSPMARTLFEGRQPHYSHPNRMTHTQSAIMIVREDHSDPQRTRRRPSHSPNPRRRRRALVVGLRTPGTRASC
jgi:hypothetical protein